MKTSSTPSTLSSRQNGSESERSVHSIHGAMGGRPRLTIDLAKAQEFLAHGCLLKSTAGHMNVGEGTLRRALGLVDVQRQGKVSPRSRQKPLGGTL